MREEIYAHAGFRPSTRDKEHTLFLWSYRHQIPKWLEACRTVCRADRVSAFAGEIIIYCRRFADVEDETMQDNVIKEVMRSPDAVEATITLIQQRDAIQDRLWWKLCDQVETQAARLGWTAERLN